MSGGITLYSFSLATYSFLVLKSGVHWDGCTRYLYGAFWLRENMRTTSAGFSRGGCTCTCSEMGGH